MRRRGVPVLLVLIAVAACVFLLWDEIEASGVLDLFDRGGEAREGDSERADADRRLEAELTRRARLRGLPGVRTSERGQGRLEGAVRRYLADAGPQPLPGVTVRVVGVGSKGGIHEEVQTDDEGSFRFEELPALVGYAVIVDQPPFKEVVLRGVNVLRDQTTDVGVILLGAPTMLAGDVVDGTGRPLSRAKVQVFADRSRPRRFDWRRGLFELQAALEPLAETDTAGDGRFRLSELPPGRYVLRVSAPGYATVFREDVWVTADERSPSVRLVLDPGAGYYGRVLDEAGNGLGAARVIAVSFAVRGSERLDRIEAESGPDGRYRLDGLVSGERYFIEAWAEGYAPAGRLAQPKEIEEKDFVLVPSGRIEGRITNEASGEGIAGAEVTIVAGMINTLSPVSAVTDADGRYVLPHVSPGPIVLFGAKADGYPAGTASGSVDGKKVVAGQTTVLDWELEPGRVAVGRVADEFGTPVAYASVAYEDPKHRDEGSETALTLADGTYRVSGLRASTYEVRITAPGYAPLTTDEEARVEIPKGVGEVQHDFVLARGAVLAGQVLDPDGAPVSGARIEVRADGARRVRERVQDLVAITAPGGRWRLTGVPPEVDLFVMASHDAWVKTESARLRLRPGEEREVDLALEPGIQLRGRVVAPGGVPVEGVRVRWGPLREEDVNRARDAFRADQYLTARVVRTDAMGGFTLDRLPAGRLLLKAEREGYADYYRRDLMVLAEGPRPDVIVELTPSATIRGTVRDALTRAPVADAWMYAREHKPGEDEPQDEGNVRKVASAQTAADGTYVLEGLPPGRYEVVVWLAIGYVAEAQNWRDESIRQKDVEAGAKDIDFALAREKP